MKTACLISGMLVCCLSAFADSSQTCSENDGFETIEEARYALRNGLLEKSKECVPKKTVYGGQSDNEVLGYIIELPNGRYDTHYPPQVAGNTHVEATTPVGAIESMHTHPYSHPDGIFSHTGLGPSGQDIATAKSTGVPSYALDCASGAVIGRDANGKDYILSCNDQNKTCAAKELSKGIVHKLSYGPDWMGLEKEPRPYSPAIGDTRYEQWQKEQQSISSGVLNFQHAIETPSETMHTDSGILNKDVRDSLMKFGETLEETLEAREDLREDRRERKAREQARREQEERERQAALEAERRQQAQRQKKNDEKREKVQAKTTPAKTSPTTPQKTTAATTATVDFSRLNSLISQQVSLVRGILSSGEKATTAQRSRFNSLNSQYASEFNRLKSQIANVSDPAKRSAYYSQLATVNRRINSELDPLLAQGQSRGLFTNL